VTSGLAKKLYREYGIFTPEMNAGPVLWRITKEMGGTRRIALVIDEEKD
jgi:RNA polymerase I-specific transcription initiation factor RRN7